MIASQASGNVRFRGRLARSGVVFIGRTRGVVAMTKMTAAEAAVRVMEREGIDMAFGAGCRDFRAASTARGVGGVGD